MDKNFKNLHENKEKPLNEIVKKVNTLLCPVLEATFSRIN